MFSPYSVSDLKRLCSEYRIRPTKDRGQNFLINETIADAAVAAAHLESGSEVIEIGPGFGALTLKLASRAHRVVAIEIEEKLSRVLEAELRVQGFATVDLICDDAVRWFLRGDSSRNAMVARSSIVASLPYAITSDFFSVILRDECLPQQLVLVVQKEVAERLAARPPRMSLLSVVAQWYGNVKVVQSVSRAAFWPQPEVESALVRIDTHDAEACVRRAQTESRTFFSFVRRAFASPRKKIKSSISEMPAHAPAAVSLLFNKRPGELNVEDWMMIATRCAGAR